MSTARYLGVDCNLCGSPLKVYEVADGWDNSQMVQGLMTHGPAVFKTSMIHLHEIAEGAGWEESPDDKKAGRVDPRWACRMCLGRMRAMHAWIKENRLHDVTESE